MLNMADTDKVEEMPVEEQAPPAAEAEAGENEEVPPHPIDEHMRGPRVLTEVA